MLLNSDQRTAITVRNSYQLNSQPNMSFQHDNSKMKFKESVIMKMNLEVLASYHYHDEAQFVHFWAEI